MKNIEQPIQSMFQTRILHHYPNQLKTIYTVYLSQNEAEIDDNTDGIFGEEPEPVKFLSVMEPQPQTLVQEDSTARLPSLDYTLFGLEIELLMSNSKTVYERS